MSMRGSGTVAMTSAATKQFCGCGTKVLRVSPLPFLRETVRLCVYLCGLRRDGRAWCSKGAGENLSLL
jgi:hypothetical protein